MTIAREITPLDLVEMTAQVAAAYFSHHTIAAHSARELVENIGRALSAVHDMMSKPVEPEGPKRFGDITERASIRTDHLISMIDGQPYKMLKRHIGLHGYTPESYRVAFGLKPDYPMTAPGYSVQRADLAKRIGLGTKANRKR